MNFVFEDLEGFRNLISCNDVNPSGIMRFTASPVATTLIRYHQVNEQFDNLQIDHIKFGSDPAEFSHYIIATGVTHSPADWCGPDKTSMFSFLNETYLADLRSKKAILLLDQSHEGYHEEWMFGQLHTECDKWNIDPTQIMYVTGNLEEHSQYHKWLEGRSVKGMMLTIPHAHFERAVFDTALNRVRIDKMQPLPNVAQNVQYKTKNLAAIRTYNALQKRPRAHRIWLFKALVEAGLLKSGYNSMNAFIHEDSYYMGKLMSLEDYEKVKVYLPMLPPTKEPLDKELADFEHQDSGKYQMRFNDDLMMDTWLTVISEASFGEDTCFISEKTFKPLAGMHPFIVYGNKYSLRNLRELGYKTFHPYINESYDELETWERLDAIVAELKRIDAMSPNEKLKWYIQMTSILHHNYNTLARNSTTHAPWAYVSIDNYFKRNINVSASNT